MMTRLTRLTRYLQLGWRFVETTFVPCVASTNEEYTSKKTVNCISYLVDGIAAFFKPCRVSFLPSKANS